MISASCEFLGCAKYGRIKAVFPANALDEWTPDGVRNVLAVSGKQKIKSMMCGGRYVQCVCLGFCGKRSSKDEMLGQRFDFRCNGDDGNACNHCKRVDAATGSPPLASLSTKADTYREKSLRSVAHHSWVIYWCPAAMISRLGRATK
uniref:Uncharacterized protein n=1 Tax=Candidatus Kentrum sp. UNK TaxID=2126344 RepID=A0A451B4M1_9GAMM|nr:MAG: hypothetical protein BECKUNK1418G_GA0071005_11787 [Candidatus Kentron sp. UNK]VFK73240.1 MAG: hypothetical protein BECKUNK1418H_GA0071006_11777 [Candidatus Kentron sp. UNK]